MIDRKDFAKKISKLGLNRLQQAIAFLWFYQYTQAYEERTASELANDIAEVGLGKPNVTQLQQQLKKSIQIVKGKRVNTFQLHLKYLDDLTAKYGPLVELKDVNVSPSIIPFDFVKGTKLYLERLVHQINGAYDYGFYDCCAVLIRRLMESLIIEVFIQKQMTQDIKNNYGFLELDKLIVKITNHPQINLNRNAHATMEKIKTIGDTAAHDRTYITQIEDINELKNDIRKTIYELLVLSNIKK